MFKPSFNKQTQETFARMTVGPGPHSPHRSVSSCPTTLWAGAQLGWCRKLQSKLFWKLTNAQGLQLNTNTNTNKNTNTNTNDQGWRLQFAVRRREDLLPDRGRPHQPSLCHRQKAKVIVIPNSVSSFLSLSLIEIGSPLRTFDNNFHSQMSSRKSVVSTPKKMCAHFQISFHFVFAVVVLLTKSQNLVGQCNKIWVLPCISCQYYIGPLLQNWGVFSI